MKGRFRQSHLTETTERLNNPWIGWYQIYTFSVNETFHPQNILLPADQRLVLLRIHLGIRLNSDLTGQNLHIIRQILSFFASSGFDIILRFVYDVQGLGQESEPTLFSQVKRHMEQLSELVGEFKRDIYLYQGLLIGSWGEMHSSRFLSSDKLLALRDIFEKKTGGDIYLGVRTPAQLRMLTPKEKMADTSLCVFDDAILGSSTHLGTFHHCDEKEWEKPWSRRQELPFLEELSRFVPIGGEAVYPQDESILRHSVEELKTMHLSYLNCCHDQKILRYWKQSRHNSRDIFRGMSEYEYIGRHLGYRFVVRSCKIKKEQNRYRLTVEIENTGFSNLYGEAVITLIQKKEDKEQLYPLDWDPKQWHSGKTIKETVNIPSIEGSLLLKMQKKSDQSTIFFANRELEEGMVILGYGG